MQSCIVHKNQNLQLGAKNVQASDDDSDLTPSEHDSLDLIPTEYDNLDLISSEHSFDLTATANQNSDLIYKGITNLLDDNNINAEINKPKNTAEIGIY